MIFCHSIILQKVVRQHDAALAKAVTELTDGDVTNQTVQFLNNLQRPLATVPDKDITHLFATNFEAEYFNAQKLLQMEGEHKLYISQDTGSKHVLERFPVQEKLYLKVGAPVLLTRNISAVFVNGLIGEVVKLEEITVTVYFAKINKIYTFSRTSFTKYDPITNQLLAERKQLPLRLAFGITVHKSQGMSLDYVHIHAEKMYRPGQLAVAVGRATSVSGICVTGFSIGKCVPSSLTVQQFYDKLNAGNIESRNDISCCRQHVPGRHSHPADDTADTLTLGEAIPEQQIQSEPAVELEDSEHEEFDMQELIDVEEMILPATTPSESTAILSSITFQTPITTQQEEENEIITRLQSDKLRYDNFFTTLFKKSLEIRKNTITEIPTTVKKLTQYNANLIKYYRSDMYLSTCKTLYQRKPSPREYSIAMKIAKEISRLVLEEMQDEHSSTSGTTSTEQQIPHFNLSVEAKGNLRYIGGMCIAKTRHKYTKQIRTHMYNKKKTAAVKRHRYSIEMLDTLEGVHADLLKSSAHKETLHATARRQNIRGALTNISDEAFNFFMKVEECRVREESVHKGKEDTHLLADIEDKVLNNTTLFHHWVKLLQNCPKSQMVNETDETEVVVRTIEDLVDGADVICDLYTTIVSKYIRVTNNQTRKDLLQTLGRKKKMAHRKSVMEKEQKKQIIVNVNDITNDKTPGKCTSHYLLKAAVSTNPTYFDSTSFTKSDLHVLCQAYNERYTGRITKEELGRKLVGVILATDEMPNPGIFQQGTSSASNPVIQTEEQQTTSTTDSMTLQSATQHQASVSPPKSKKRSSSSNSQETQSSVGKAIARKASSKSKKRSSSGESKETQSTVGKAIARKESSSKSKPYSKKRKGKATEDESEDTELCMGCCTVSEGQEQWVCCDSCDGWYHRECAGLINAAQWRAVEESTWLCPDCQF
ncbi:uncharacterized protein [Ptychodera flava]|uniref:uncharacterized protein n=1 Tax=Ptychodera flava TaxID=63121 RepID=UPI003969E172